MPDKNKRQMLAARRTLVIGAALLWATCPDAACAHKGPPFPILMDKPLADHLVSVWADPDIGEATFFIILESPSGGQPMQTPRVSMWTEPVSGRLGRVTYTAEQQALKNQMEFTAKPNFDQRDFWTVGFRLTSSDGKSEELTTQVESTPPGFGPWDLAIYLFPFLFLGGMWAMAMVRRSRMKLPENSELTGDAAHPEQAVLEAKAEDGT